MASEILHSQTSSSQSTLPPGFTALVRECVQALRDLHAQETTLVTQLTDLLEAVEAEQEESERGRKIKGRLIELTAGRSLP